MSSQSIRVEGARFSGIVPSRPSTASAATGIPSPIARQPSLRPNSAWNLMAGERSGSAVGRALPSVVLPRPQSAGRANFLEVSGSSVQAKHRKLFDALRLKNVQLESRCIALQEYVKVLERDTEMLRTGRVVPREVVDELEEFFAKKEIEARRVPELEMKLAGATEAAAEARRRLKEAEEQVETLQAAIKRRDAQ